MKSSSTPSQEVAEVMTDGQIEKLTDNIRAALRNVRRKFSAADVQKAFERGQLDVEVRLAVEAAVEQVITKASNTIIRIVSKLDRSRNPQQVLDDTKRVQHTDENVVATMPSGSTGMEENVEVVFFKLGRYVSHDELAREYGERDLTPDPYTQAAVNEADLAFADKHPNGTHWKDANGKWCFMAFRRCTGERNVGVYCSNSDWGDDWWFGGVKARRATVKEVLAILKDHRREFEDKLQVVPISLSFPSDGKEIRIKVSVLPQHVEKLPNHVVFELEGDEVNVTLEPSDDYELFRTP